LTNVVIIGGQWGDEGKAKIIDLLADKADVIIRYQGGCNAGHTVVVNNETYKFHLVPSGILYPGKTCIIGNGTVINPQVLSEEIDKLKTRGIDTSGLCICGSAHVTMPYHIALDELSEDKLGEKKIGTTKKGIGPTYVDKIDRTGIRIEDFFEKEYLEEKLEIILPKKNLILQNNGQKPFSKDEIINFCLKYSKILQPYVKDTVEITMNAVKENKNILFEGAQGAMLDVDHGTYPYVTSSNPVAGNASIGSGIGASYINKYIGVFKVYVTRVGEGPFVTELKDSVGDKLQQIGNEVGTTTGRKRRCGWFDAVSARYSVFINGLDSIALTKLDVLDSFDEIKICTAYKDARNGKIYTNYPVNSYIHRYLKPVYTTYPGWNQNISGCSSMESLPENAQKFISAIETHTGLPATVVSVGAEREKTILRQKIL
jgi:adenylosuccinate synthase